MYTLIDYLCKDCGFEFCSEQKDLACPNCESILFEAVVDVGLLYLLGDWFDLWGKD